MIGGSFKLCVKKCDVSERSVRKNVRVTGFTITCVKDPSSHVEMIGDVETVVLWAVKEGCRVLGSLKVFLKCMPLGMASKKVFYIGLFVPTVFIRAATKIEDCSGDF